MIGSDRATPDRSPTRSFPGTWLGCWPQGSRGFSAGYEPPGSRCDRVGRLASRAAERSTPR